MSLANNDIKQKIVLDGEKEYKAALKDAQRELRTLRSELKAETAELGKNATEQEKARVKAQNLKKQIEEQKKVVDTYRKALEEVKDKYSDDADAIAKWEIKLNDARATLANMQKDLDGVGESFKKNSTDAAMGTVAAKSYADALGNIANVGQSVSDAIEGIFSGMVSIVQNSIGVIWEDLVDLAARSNAWGDIAGFWNTDAAEIEKWDRAVTAATDNFSDLTSAVLKINNLDDKQQKKITELTGVSGANYEDRWQYAMAVMTAMSDMPYDKMLQASEEIFGAKRATGVLDLLQDWEKIEEGLVRFDAENGGLGLNNEQIDNMITLDQRIATLQQTWQAFVDSFEATHFAKLALDLTGNAQAILDAFIDYMNADSDSERQEALDRLQKNLEDFFTRIGEAIAAAAEALDRAGGQLQTSENGTVRTIGTILTTLSSVLEWFADNANIDNVIDAFKTLAEFWVVGQGVKLVNTIASLAANFKIIQGFSFSGAAASATGAATSSLTTLGGSIANAIAGVTMSVGLVTIAIPVVSALKDIIAGQWPSWLPNPETANEVEEEFGVNGTKNAVNVFDGNTTKNALQWGFGKLFGGDNETKQEQEEPNPYANLPTANLGAYEGMPVYSERTPNGTMFGFDATPEQMAAVEAFWDIWKSGVGGEEYDNAWDLMESAFEGNEDTFNKMTDMLDELWTWLETNGQDPGELNDLPANWWRNGGADENGITVQDMANFNSMPDKTAAAVGKAVGGIRVDMDGYSVGRLIAPYVSQIIARDMV